MMDCSKGKTKKYYGSDDSFSIFLGKTTDMGNYAEVYFIDFPLPTLRDRNRNRDRDRDRDTHTQRERERRLRQK
tara:strand:+ start:359 stop:580 length:222 start_codon:yes stop_codon:yes gene_type:complete